MASDVGIVNRGLQKLGASRITALSDNSVNARAASVAFEPLRQALLRAHPWKFAITRVQLAADATAPIFGKENYFTLPSDFLAIAPPDGDFNPNSKDWEIEGRKLVTNDSAPLDLKYIKDVTDPNDMDPLFREALSSLIAYELCEEITQSNTKKAGLLQDKKDAIAEARRRNAIQSRPIDPMEDTWVTSRA